MSSISADTGKGKIKNRSSGYRGDPNAYRPFKCDQCDKAFRRRFTLQEHKKIHTGEKPFACTFPGCTSRFSTSGNLSRHKRVHLSDRYRCPVASCGLAFSSHSGLSKHVKTHTEAPPYACPVSSCPKVFSTAANLVRHTHSHRASELLAESTDSSLHRRISSQGDAPPPPPPASCCFPKIPRLSALPNIELASPETLHRRGRSHYFRHGASMMMMMHHPLVTDGSFAPLSSDFSPFGLIPHHACGPMSSEERTAYPPTPLPASSGYPSECTSPLSSSLRHILCPDDGFSPPFHQPQESNAEEEEWTPRRRKPSEMKAVLDNLLYGTEMSDSYHHSHSHASRPHSPFEIVHSMFNFEEQDNKVHQEVIALDPPTRAAASGHPPPHSARVA